MTISIYLKDLGAIYPSQENGRLKIFVIIFTEEATLAYQKLSWKFTELMADCTFPAPNAIFSHVLTGFLLMKDVVSFDFKKYEVDEILEFDKLISQGQFGFSVLNSPDGLMHDIYAVCSSRGIRKVVPKFFNNVFSANTLSSTQLLFNGGIDVLASLFPTTRFSLGVLFDNPDYEAAIKVYTRAGFTNPQLESSLDMPSRMGIPRFLKLSTSAATYKQDRANAALDFRKALRIRKNFWKDPCRGSRGVLVINFIENSTQSLNYSGRFCDDTEKIPYDVLYTEIQVANYLTESVTLSQILSQVIPECSLVIMYVNGDATLAMFYDFITTMRQFVNTTAYVSASNPISVPSTVLGLRILNIQDWPTPTLQTQTVQKDDHEIIQVNLASQPQTRDLECTWWFQRSVLKAFGCGVNRLLQISGTCFLNVIVNGFLLSENPRKMLLANLDMVLVNEPGYRAILERPLEEWACPIRYMGRRSLDFMNMILYRTYNKTKIKSTFDILKITSRRFVSMNPSPTDVLYGHGGMGTYTVLDFLQNVNFPGFIGNHKTSDYLYLAPIPSTARTDVYETYLTSLNKIPDLREVARFHYYIDKEPLVLHPKITPAHLDIGGTTYDLEFACININLGPNWHLIVGIICNGVQMIYDSYNNIFFKANWQNLNDPTVIAAIKKVFPTTTDSYIEFAFYMNSTIY